MVTVSGGLGAWRWGADGAVRWLGRFASLTALALAHSLSLSPASFFSFVSLSVFLPHLIVRVYITIQKSSFSPPRHSNIRLSLLFLSLSLPFVPAHPIFRHWIIVIVIVAFSEEICILLGCLFSWFSWFGINDFFDGMKWVWV